MRYFIMISKMELSKKLKVKCCIEVVLNIILRIFTFYPFLLINYVFALFEKAFDFLDNLFYNISTFSKKNICISIINKKESKQIEKELKKLLTKNNKDVII